MDHGGDAEPVKRGLPQIQAGLVRVNGDCG
jgi:hypothetical protein